MAQRLDHTSVALVTRNRPQSLERTLTSLRAQSEQPWEVVVSDDSDPPYTSAVRRIVDSYGWRYIAGPGRGLYANRNHAALACSGSHIRTMDDDHEFPPGHWATCRHAVTKDPSAIWVIGEEQPGQPVDDRYDCPPQLHPRGFSVTPSTGRPIWSISDGAAIYPASLFERGLRLAEHYPFGAAYLEWGSRLNWLGYRIRHLKGTWVMHHFDPNARSFMDDEVTLGSKFFAMLAHSLLYQPTMRNQVLTFGEIARQLALRPRLAVPALSRAIGIHRRHQRRTLADSRLHGRGRSAADFVNRDVPMAGPSEKPEQAMTSGATQP